MGLAEDLRFAQVAQRQVNVSLLNGDTLTTGVEEVNEAEGWVNLYAPEYYGDLSTRRVLLELVASVAVTEVEYKVE